MSKLLSLKMDERIFEDTENVLKKIRLPRNAYINRAVEFYNRVQSRLLAKKRLKQDVELLKTDTQEFIDNFEFLDDLPE